MNKIESSLLTQAENLLDDFFMFADEYDIHRLMKIGEWWRLVELARHYSDDVSLSAEELFILREGEKRFYLSQGAPNLPAERLKDIDDAINADRTESDVALGLCCCTRIVHHLADENEAMILFRIACERRAFILVNPSVPNEAIKSDRVAFATLGAEALHSKPGGAWDKQKQIRDIWASGKYSSRDLCAEQEYAALHWNFASARRALRKTPDPS
jgi:hypothetical protein